MLKSIRVLPQFERDVKRLKKKHFPLDKLRSAVSAIFKDSRDELRRLRDHELKGNWLGYRELHIERKWLNIPCRPPTPSPVTRASRANRDR